MASSLYHAGDLKTSQKLKEEVAEGRGFLISGSDKKGFKKILKSSQKFTNMVVKPKMIMEDFQDQSTNVVSAVLLGSDGSHNHRVAVWGSWLFDSNLPTAIPLTQDNLNWCVDGNNVGTTCVSMEDAYVLLSQTKNVARRNQRKRRKLKKNALLC
jgi:hypothetical protein